MLLKNKFHLKTFQLHAKMNSQFRMLFIELELKIKYAYAIKILAIFINQILFLYLINSIVKLLYLYGNVMHK